MSRPTFDLGPSQSATGLASALALWPRVTYADGGKRLFDIVLAVLMLGTLVVVLPVLWAAVRADGGPGFFGHKRVGRHGRMFRCWKLRTMVPDAEARLAAHLSANPEAAEEWSRDFKLRDDPRVTRLGRFLRKSSLDELPQVWNVLRGEMSFVGPRPVVSEELAYYGEAAERCFCVRPGVTGLWQVSGRNDVAYPERVRMDLAYASSISLKADLRILLMTAAAVVNRTGH
jgi:lipopolysaccharide/colanic/teichoic acid biosynthesis glycosyltransferase